MIHKCSDPKISVIVPVYNVREYVEICLNSIIRQTFKDIEIILIDDGSTDDSGYVCDQYATFDNRIKIIHKCNEGLSAARNEGILYSAAPYILFVDSDDWIEEDTCEKLYYAAIDNNADIVVFLYYKIDSNGRITKIDTDLKEGLLSEEGALYFNTHVSCSAWVNLYKKELFNTIRFPNGKYYEDLGTTHKLIRVASRIFFFKENLYYYRANRTGSITNSKETRNHPDKEEMRILKLKDLKNWGYDDYYYKCALSYIIESGRRNIEKDYFETAMPL